MANGLINRDLIMKAWAHLRKTEMTIPNETLDFMRDAALEKCAIMDALDWSIPEIGSPIVHHVRGGIPTISPIVPTPEFEEAVYINDKDSFNYAKYKETCAKKRRERKRKK